MQITKTIHQLKIPFQIPITPEKSLDRFVNLFLIIGEKIHLIDSGVTLAYPIIEEYLNHQGRNISQIKNLFLTHSHPDHIGSAKLISKKTTCTVFAHASEKEMIENTTLQFSKRPVPGFHNLVAGPVNVDLIVTDGQTFSVEDGITLRVIHTPGHSPGSVSYLFEEENVLFSGDAVLLPGEIPVFENVTEYFNSIEKIRKLSPEILLSAWDKPQKSETIKFILNQSVAYILKIQQAAKNVAINFTANPDIDYCKKVLKQLGQPEIMANPLLLKSFIACLAE